MAQIQTTAGTLAGYFSTYQDAERAVDALREAGFTSAHIGVAHRGGSFETGSSASDTMRPDTSRAGEQGEGAWDKFKSFFGAGNAAEPYADERTRGDFADREVTYADSDVNSAYIGGLHESLNDLSVPSDRSRYFSHRFDSGDEGTVVTVNAGDRYPEAEAILNRFGADLGADAESYDYSESSAGSTPREGAQNIQLLGEVLRVQKDRISRGEVRIRKEVITENQTIQVPVTREELVIERHAVDGITPASGTIGDSDEIRIPLTQETASVDKSTVVREEVSVGKRDVSETRNLASDIRHEELVVEDETKTVNR